MVVLNYERMLLSHGRGFNQLKAGADRLVRANIQAVEKARRAVRENNGLIRSAEAYLGIDNREMDIEDLRHVLTTCLSIGAYTDPTLLVGSYIHNQTK